MKKMKKKVSIAAIALRVGVSLLLALSLLFTLSIAASAEESGESETAGASDGGFLDTAIGYIGEHLPLFLSALTLLATGVLTRLFRSSLLPILEGGIGRLGGGVRELEEKTAALLSCGEAEIASLHALLKEMKAERESEGERRDRCIDYLRETVDELRERARCDAARLDGAILMLKEVFTAARLPAASKLALEEIYRKTEQLSAGVGLGERKTEGSP